MALVTAPASILNAWRELGVSDDVLAGALNVDRRTIDRWGTGISYPQTEAREALAALECLSRHLLDTFDDAEAARAWLCADLRYLGGLRPVDALRAGRIDRVEAALEALDSGTFV